MYCGVGVMFDAAGNTTGSSRKMVIRKESFPNEGNVAQSESIYITAEDVIRGDSLSKRCRHWKGGIEMNRLPAPPADLEPM